MTRNNRSQEEIVADILSVVRNEPKKTHIMYGANLSYSILCKYLNMLITANLIHCREDVRIYELTELGDIYLHRYKEYKALEETLILNESRFNKKRDGLQSMLRFPE